MPRPAGSPEDSLLVTLDTNQLDTSTIAELRAAVGAASLSVAFATVTVNERERGHLSGVHLVLESAVWAESTWDGSVWGDTIHEVAVVGETPLGHGVVGEQCAVLEEALRIISNGSFPKPSDRGQMSKGHLRLLRDAMTFEAHVRARRHVLVSADKDLTGLSTRAKLEALGRTHLVHPEEFRAFAGRDELARLRYI